MNYSISIKTTKGVFSISDFNEQNLLKSDIIGVVLQTETIGMVISLEKWNAIWCSKENVKIFNKLCDEVEALRTLSGLELTRNIVEKNIADGESTTAAMLCWQYKKGNLQWYLPSLYELGTIIAYRDELNEVLEMLDADQFDEDDWGLSSSENYSWSAWFIIFGSGNFYNGSKYGSFVVMAVSAFSQLQREKSIQ